MKYLVLLSLLSSISGADVIYKDKPCKVYNFEMVITNKLNDRQYEGVTDMGNKHFIYTLRSAKKVSIKKGPLYNTLMQEVAVKKMKMEDGYEQSVFFFNECGDTKVIAKKEQSEGDLARLQKCVTMCTAYTSDGAHACNDRCKGI